jgi:DNA-binding transcriptional ArsR family regulator
MESLTQLDPDFQLDTTAQLFKALAEPARLRILNLLVHGGELCNCQVEAVTGYRNPKISRHFQFLKHAGLIQFRREGTWIFYSLRQPESDRLQTVQALLPLLAQWHPICVQDLERWKTIAQLPLSEICSR